MARPELPIGTWGTIRPEKLAPHRFRARARFRDYDGRTRDVEATSTTGPAAVRALNVKLRDRTTPHDDEITGEERLAPQTIQRYETSLRTAILPALGDL